MVLAVAVAMAQAPEKFTYQAVVRNASNSLVANAPVGVRVSILQGGVNGTLVYMETQTGVTNANGLITLQIGGGNVQEGAFADIDWANGSYFLKTETDPNGGTNYSITSTQQMLSVPYALYSKEAGNGFSGDYNDLVNVPQIPQIPADVSAFNNDAGYITDYTETDPQYNAWNKDYNDLINKPTIPTVPTYVSAFTNDAGYLTNFTETDPQFNAWDKDYNDLTNKPTIPTVPTNVSTFTNDAGYVTTSQLNAANYITAAQVPTQVNADWNATTGAAQILNKPTLFSGNYNDLINKPTIPTVPTYVSAFTNDAGYLTNFTESDPQFSAWDKDYNDLTNKPTLFSGNYNDLTNKPMIPTVPTNVSDFNNDAGYITLSQVPTQVNADWNATSGAAQILNKPNLFSGNYNDLTNKPILFSGNYNDLTNKPTLFDGNYNSLTNRPNLAAVAISGNYNDLINKPAIPTAVGELTNNVGYITQAQVPAQVNADWNATSGAAQILNKPVLFSGDYNDLTNRPQIPQIPADVSAFNNDAGYITSYTESQILSISNDTLFLTGGSFVKLPAGFDGDYNSLTNKPNLFSGNYNDLTNLPQIPQIPADVSAFNNDAGYITAQDIPAIPTVPTNVSAFSNDAGYLTSFTEQQVLSISNDTLFLTGGSFVKLPAGFDGDYNSLTNKPELFSGDYNDLDNLPQIPADVSAFNNDAGYLTDYTETDPQFSAWDKDYNDLTNKPVLFDGDYNSLTNKPVLFDGDYNSLANTPTIPTVPSNVSAFNNDAGYITAVDVQQAANIPTNLSAFENDANYITVADIPAQVNADWDATSGAAQILNKPTLFSGNYNDLTNKPTIPTVPANVGAFNNDAHYLTEWQINLLLSPLINTIDSLRNRIEEMEVNMSALENEHPTITTVSAINVTETTAQSGGVIISDGGKSVSVRGVCWDISHNPTIDGNHTDDGSGKGSYVSILTGLNSGTTYYMRAYAINDEGVFYGNEESFTTPTPFVCGTSTVRDFDGNIYHTLQIGSQCWMKENMRTTHYATGFAIAHANVPQQSSSVCYYYTGNTQVYGFLYNWPAVIGPDNVSANNQGVCPSGWHVPSDGEWAQLATWVGNQSEYRCSSNSNYNAKALASSTGWQNYAGNCCVGYMTTNNNSTGFSAFPAGYFDGNYHTQSGYSAFFWSSSEYSGQHAYAWTIYNSSPMMEQYGNSSSKAFKNYGGSVRCLRDEGVSASLPVLSTNMVSSIKVTSAVAGGYITSSGGKTVTARGVCWSTSHSPTINDHYTIDGLGTGNFTSNLTGLSGGTTYYIRAYALNEIGIAYGEEVSFTTQTPSLPVLTTSTVTVVTTSTAETGGDITHSGSSPIIERGICWGTSHNPTISNSHIANGAGIGDFSIALTGLSSGTTYFVRAYAINSEGTSYGNELSFTTLMPVLPSLTTKAPTYTTTTTATSGGNITKSGGSVVISRGVCWSTSHNPTTYNSHTVDGTGTGSYTSALTGLSPGTTYYVRAYAINEVGVAYGNEVSLTTKTPFVCGESVVNDYDGNVYNTVQIGDQCWMKENMRTTHYSNGTLIMQGNMSQSSTTTCYYYNPSNAQNYGYLYNWPAAIGIGISNSSNQGVCPLGWHLPGDAEWIQLIQYIGSQSQYVCNNNIENVAKALSSTTGWIYSNYNVNCNVGYSPNNNNSSGFDAVPAGYFSLNTPNIYGGFYEVGENAMFWSCTSSSNNEAYCMELYYNYSTAFRNSYSKSIGASVRCLRD